ncbi:MAG TPA: ankyrin repeat domain-containing protein [Dokdonella sp.]|nr:ankyrin repeat domain-containing protein [Dokdonella sp.]
MPDTNFPSTLFQAIQRSDIEQVKSIYSEEGGKEINAVFDENGDTPLIRAACRGEATICEFLISTWRASPHAASRIGRTALMELIRTRSEKWPAKLAAHFASSVNAQDYSGKTALMFAAKGAGVVGSRRGNLTIIRQLMEFGANVSLRNNRGVTALGVAQTENNDSPSLANQPVIDFLKRTAIEQRALTELHRNNHCTFDANGELILQPKPAQ